MNMTEQKILDFTFEKLWNQNRISIYPGKASCAYRGPNGTKCAVGWLIPDEKYQWNFEQKNLEDIWEVLKFPVRLLSFIRKLQVAHDTCFDKFRTQILDNYIKVAEMYELDTSFIESFKE